SGAAVLLRDDPGPQARDLPRPDARHDRLAEDVRPGGGLRQRRPAQVDGHPGLLRLRPHVPGRVAAAGRLRRGGGAVPRRPDAGGRAHPAPVRALGGGMTTATVAAAARPAGVSEEAFRRWQARRRWSRAAIVYVVMLVFGILLVG